MISSHASSDLQSLYTDPPPGICVVPEGDDITQVCILPLVALIRDTEVMMTTHWMLDIIIGVFCIMGCVHDCEYHMVVYSVDGTL